MCINKDHWYDGFFYDRVIAPNQDRAYRIVKSIISENSSVLDVGCGTGRLAFRLGDKTGSYDGVDPSVKNINTANSNLLKNPSSKIKFHHSDILSFLKSSTGNYDFAIISYVIHEIDENEREHILRTISLSVKNIIIIDYLFPKPKGFYSLLNEIVEFMAGQEHYRNFKSYISAGGIQHLADKTGLSIIKEIKNSPLTSHIAILRK